MQTGIGIGNHIFIFLKICIVGYLKICIVGYLNIYIFVPF